MQSKSIIITGKNGQLGNELAGLTNLFPSYHYVFTAHSELDIADRSSINKIFEKYKPLWFINTAAYTAVDKAETQQQQAYKINAEAPGIIAEACKNYNTRLIHISTDYVFDGKGNKPYKEEEATSPINYYGHSKWIGEQIAFKNNSSTIVIRTSWLYSKYGNNFVKTMLRLMQERQELNVVNDQFGSPTWAKNLSETIFTIIGKSDSPGAEFKSGIYHYSNEGVISWYDFALAIKRLKSISCKVNPVATAQYPTPANRPAWSVMDKEKIKTTFGLEIPRWQQSLEQCLAEF